MGGEQGCYVTSELASFNAGYALRDKHAGAVQGGVISEGGIFYCGETLIAPYGTAHSREVFGKVAVCKDGSGAVFKGDSSAVADSRIGSDGLAADPVSGPAVNISGIADNRNYTLYRFNLSSIPAGTTVVTATLRLYVEPTK